MDPFGPSWGLLVAANGVPRAYERACRLGTERSWSRRIRGRGRRPSLRTLVPPSEALRCLDLALLLWISHCFGRLGGANDDLSASEDQKAARLVAKHLRRMAFRGRKTLGRRFSFASLFCAISRAPGAQQALGPSCTAGCRGASQEADEVSGEDGDGGRGDHRAQRR